MTEDTRGEPLAAPVGAQLREKAELEERSAAERQEEERRRERLERRKADERDTVLRHTGGQRRLRPRRTASTSRATPGRLPPWAVPAAIVAGLWFARRRRLALVAGVGIGAALLAALAQDRLETY